MVSTEHTVNNKIQRKALLKLCAGKGMKYVSCLLANVFPSPVLHAILYLGDPNL